MALKRYAVVITTYVFAETEAEAIDEATKQTILINSNDIEADASIEEMYTANFGCKRSKININKNEADG